MGGAVSGLQCSATRRVLHMTVWTKNRRFAFPIACLLSSPAKHMFDSGLQCVRTRLFARGSLDFYGHLQLSVPSPIRLLACKSVAFFFGLAVSVFLFASVQGFGGGRMVGPDDVHADVAYI